MVDTILLAMVKRSAGLLMFRRRGKNLEVFLVHPGGPFWATKDAGAWMIPKGEYADDEEPLAAAQREFREETGFEPGREFIELGMVKQAGGKLVTVWAFEGDCDPAKLVSNLCVMEWPPHSKRMVEVPEADRGAWFTLPAAQNRILKSQSPFLEVLTKKIQI